MAKRIVLDLDYCIGCRSCVAACQAAYAGEARICYGDLEPTAALPLACRHCEEPLCVAACPSEALFVAGPEKLVLHSSFRCTGCGSCALACPWGVIDVRLLRSVAQKCTQCAEREVKSGRKGPRCVAACASGALRFLDEAELPKAEVGRRFISRSPYWRRT